MCGRTACTLAPDELSRASWYRDRSGRRRRPQWREGDAEKYRPSYNRSPQSLGPVLLSHRHFNKDAPVDECVLALMRWGLVPAWFRDSDPKALQFSTSNCRSESILQKKSYKEPLLQGRRCVVLVDGFYEWRRQEKDKQPFFIYFPQSPPGLDPAAPKPPSCPHLLDQGEEGEGSEWTGWKLLTVAGLFDRWSPPGGGEDLYSYTVLTVEASPSLQGIHDRMPAVLDGEDAVQRWLDFGEVRPLDALTLLRPTDCLTFHPVSALVNNSRNNSPTCLQPSQTPPPSASSKMMRNWLSAAPLQKRKASETPEEQGGVEVLGRGGARSGILKWVTRTDPNKKPRTG